jgi:hypothetical protein
LSDLFEDAWSGLFCAAVCMSMGVLMTYLFNYLSLSDTDKQPIGRYIGIHFPGLVLLLILIAIALVTMGILLFIWNRVNEKAAQKLKSAEKNAEFTINRGRDDAAQVCLQAEMLARQRTREAGDLKKEAEIIAGRILQEAKVTLAEAQNKRNEYLQEITGLQAKIKHLATLLIQAKIPLSRNLLKNGLDPAISRMEKRLRREIGVDLYDTIIAELAEKETLHQDAIQ